MNLNSYYNCTLYAGTNARGRVLKLWRVKTFSADDAVNAFHNKFSRQFMGGYLVVESGSDKVATRFNSIFDLLLEDDDDDEEEEEDDWEDEEEEEDYAEEEDYDDEYEEEYEEEWDNE